MSTSGKEQEIRLVDSQADSWRTSQVLNAVDRTISELADAWNLDREEILGPEDPVDVEIDGFGASVDRDTISVSDPDYYRIGMRQNFDDCSVIDTVDTTYPVPFHEVLEEVGQVIGRRASNGWEYRPTVIDGARDEFHGLLALNRSYPGFMDAYREKVEENLETVVELNSREEEERFLDLKRGGIDNQELEDFYNSALQEDYSFSRENGSIPNSFSVKLASRIIQDESLGFEDFGAEEVKELRYEKLRKESAEERANLIGFDLVEIVGGKEFYRAEDAFNEDEYFNSWFRRRASQLDQGLKIGYDIPQEPTYL